MAGEVIGTRWGPAIVVSLNGHVVKLPLKYVYTNKSVLPSTLVGEASFCSFNSYYRDAQLEKMLIISDSEYSALKGTFIPTIPNPQGSGKTLEMGVERT